MKEDSHQPILHLGFPKCASTFLQREIFPRLESLPFFPDQGEGSILSNSRYGELPRDLSFFERGKTRYLYSCEGITAYKLNPLFKHKGYDFRENCLNAMLHIFRDYGKFLIVIRRQDDLAKSFFKAYASAYLGRPEHLFIDFPATEHGNTFRVRYRHGMTYLESFDFEMVVSRIASVVGRDRIHILLYEELREAPSSFFGRLGDVLGEDMGRLVQYAENYHNVSKTHQFVLPTYLWGLRKIARRIPHYQSVKSLFAKEIEFSDAFEKDIMAYYRAGNERLCKEFRLPGKDYGYY